MHLPNRTPIAAALIALCAGFSSSAQAASITIEAESMSLSSYVVENGTRIRVASGATTGTATKSFSGTAGTYDMVVTVLAENDGQPTLEVYKGATLLRKYTYPLANALASFTIPSVPLAPGETIRLVGRTQGGAVARVDRLVLNAVASSTPSTTTSTTSTTTTTTTTTATTTSTATTAAAPTLTTMEAETMSLSSYVVENGTRIRVASGAAAGTATKGFPGATGTYDMQVTVVAESDGQPTLEVYKGATLLKKYSYPLADAMASFTIPGVPLTSGEAIKLIGRMQGNAWARVDKIVFSPVKTSTSTTTGTSTSTSACANPSGGYQGFGRNTTGGAGKTIYRVTNLNDSGAGSLRDALSQGNRCIMFDVAGTISLSSNMLVRGANVTIDGLTAPSPGITLRGGTLVVQGASGASNVVLRGLRHRAAPDDNIRVYNASNVVIDRVSVSGYGDGGIDVTEKSRDVTIQWSILGNGSTSLNKANLIAYSAARVTVHHNLYIASEGRHPYCGISDNATALPPEIVCDVRNNLVWDFKTGTDLQDYGKANVVNNYYYSTRAYSTSHAIRNDGTADAYVSGNYSQNGWHINGSTRSTPFDAVVPATTDAVTAAKEVLAKAGARGPRFGLDSLDQGYIGQVKLQ